MHEYEIDPTTGRLRPTARPSCPCRPRPRRIGPIAKLIARLRKK